MANFSMRKVALKYSLSTPRNILVLVLSFIEFTRVLTIILLKNENLKINEEIMGHSLNHVGKITFI